MIEATQLGHLASPLTKFVATSIHELTRRRVSLVVVLLAAEVVVGADEKEVPAAHGDAKWDAEYMKYNLLLDG